MQQSHQMKSLPATNHQSYNSTSSSNPPKPIHVQLLSAYEQIKYGINTHNNLVHELLENNIQSQIFLNSRKKQQIATHCNQYSKTSPLVIDILNGRVGSGLHFQQENFWHVNEGLQRELQINLKDLKVLDGQIDNVINQEFDKCNQIDDTQQKMRVILSRKDAGHIEKAEPYFQKKQQCLCYLQNKKKQKQHIKHAKFLLINKIISLLDQLKRHREAGLKVCLSQQNEHRALQINHNIIQRMVSDIREVVSYQHQIQKKQIKMINFQNQSNQLYGLINNIQSRIEKTIKQLCNLMEQQNQIAFKFQEFAKFKSETQYFQTSIFSVFGVSNIRRFPKNQYVREIQSIMEKLQRFVKDNQEKDKQIAKIEQSVETTKKTLAIFDSIKMKIETESMRKNQLIKDIQKMQQKHIQQDRILHTISDNENQLQKLKLRTNQLNKNLQTKLNEANLIAYKNIHEEITKIQQQIYKKMKEIQSNRQTVSQNARLLYDQALKIQQSYEDILSQVIPSIWLKGNDFDKEESIKDLNLYLLKIFKRLSIAD